MTLDVDDIRQGLGRGQGKRYWRGLEELAASEQFREFIEREFPEHAAEWTNPVTRREFLLLMGASLALAGMSGCSSRPAPAEKILPYVRQPEELVPGKPLFFATAMTLGGVATGLLVESHEGRPTKIEGNPDHPGCPSDYQFGPTDLFAQASILGLYDPDRSQSVTHLGQPRPWDELRIALAKALPEQKRPASQGAGLRILTEIITSPTLAHQIETLGQVFPKAKWHQYQPVGRDNVRAGALQAFGKEVNTSYRLKDAEVILALDADFLSCGPGHLRYVREFMDGRRVRRGQAKMNRLYVAEGMPSNTGAVADHRLPLRAGEIERFARAVAAELRIPGVPGAGAIPEDQQRWIAALASDLGEHRGRSLVIAGDGQSAGVHALAHAMNHALGNVGKTVIYTRPVEARPADQLASLRELVEDMKNGRVELLFILGSNPVFTAPADFQFEEQLKKVKLRIHLGLYQDETAALCQWHVPEAHYLEAWSDGRAYDGTVTIMQPLIAPLYGDQVKSAHELLGAMLAPFQEQSLQSGYEIVRAYWRQHWPKPQDAGDFEDAWRQALHNGVIAGTQFKHDDSISLKADWAGQALAQPKALGEDELEIVFRPDPTIYDGRFANNGWLQELPKPITKLTWDNAAIISPATAEKLGLRQTFAATGGEHGHAIVEMIKLEYRGQEIAAPVWILPGHADDAVTVHFGYGRTRAGHVGDGRGFNFYKLRTSAAPWFDTGLQIGKTGRRYHLACTQMHHSMQERAPVRAATLEEFRDKQRFARIMTATEHQAIEVRQLIPGPQAQTEEKAPDRRLVPLTLYNPNEHPYNGYKWAMAIDLTACTGCSACVVACQAENNIPVVGKTEVLRGREMHWLRLDRYYVSDPKDPKPERHPATYFQPVPCMQCEDAPCELVCPVAATVHSQDGLNDMVYNRCVGTRYCSNNCPYKVRRFNFLQYADYATKSLKFLHNPEVTVRSRGVMEKCTYCVQRIRAAEIEAKRQDRRDPQRPGVAPIHDHEVLTACQAACPANAIVFGDLNDHRSQVWQCKEQPLNYALLGELNTRPRTTYLAALRNPNSKLQEHAAG